MVKAEGVAGGRALPGRSVVVVMLGCLWMLEAALVPVRHSMEK